ncbi:hypothetical protein GUITHDRAFT_148035, partial [Guillardia theta CCMP2712]
MFKIGAFTLVLLYELSPACCFKTYELSRKSLHTHTVLSSWRKELRLRGRNKSDRQKKVNLQGEVEWGIGRELTRAKVPPHDDDVQFDEDEDELNYQRYTPLRKGFQDISPNVTRDMESYAAEAARCLDDVRLEEAEACYKQALLCSPPPHPPWLLNAYAALLADQSRVGEAETMFKESINVSLTYNLTRSHLPYMYLGQIMEGRGGIEYYKEGIKLLEDRECHLCEANMHETDEKNSTTLQQLFACREQLSTAYCSLAEALLVEDDTGKSDDKAEELFFKAIRVKKDHVDALQGLASLRL